MALARFVVGSSEDGPISLVRGIIVGIVIGSSNSSILLVHAD